MRKFIVLVKKEIKELLTLQVIVPMLIAVLAFILIGNIIGSEARRAMEAQDIAVLDQDNSPVSQQAIDFLRINQFQVQELAGPTVQGVIEEVKERELGGLIVIPEGFSSGLAAHEPQEIQTYTVLRSFAMTGSAGVEAISGAVGLINEFVSTQLITREIPGVSIGLLKNPIHPRDIVIIGDNQAQVHPSMVMGFITSQTIFIPIILFFVIIFAAQMIVASVATEKENKTLETLLTTPVSRSSLVSSKMVAAGIIALLVSLVYMVGFSYYMGGIMEGVGGQITAGMGEAMVELGLVLHLSSYVFLGLSVFFAILCALAIALILGSFAQDLKSAQGLIAPMTFLIMIPYILALFLDMTTLTPVIRYLIYAIPFAHPFMAVPNLFLQNYNFVLAGIIYQGVVFVIFVLIAARIYSSDRVLTMKLKLRKS